MLECIEEQTESNIIKDEEDCLPKNQAVDSMEKRDYVVEWWN